MKARIDKIVTREYRASFNKYLAIARIKKGGKWMYVNLWFATEKECNRVKAGDEIDPDNLVVTFNKQEQ